MRWSQQIVKMSLNNFDDDDGFSSLIIICTKGSSNPAFWKTSKENVSCDGHAPPNRTTRVIISVHPAALICGELRAFPALATAALSLVVNTKPDGITAPDGTWPFDNTTIACWPSMLAVKGKELGAIGDAKLALTWTLVKYLFLFKKKIKTKE